MSRSTHMTPLPAGFVPGPNTIICAKGKDAKSHPGNRWLRTLVKEHLQEYSDCPSKLERSFIVSKIMKMIRAASPGGAFVRNVNGVWYDVGDRNSREKIGQKFRDELHTEFRSSTKAKANRRREREANMSSQDSSSDGSGSLPMSPGNKRQKIADVHCPITPPRSCQAMAISPFPVHEVSFSVITPVHGAEPAAKLDTEMDLTDLEPLPLAQALSFQQKQMATDFSLSADSVISEHSTFEEAMDELYNSSFAMI